MSTSSPAQNLLNPGPTFHTNVHGERRFHDLMGRPPGAGRSTSIVVVRDSEVGRPLVGVVSTLDRSWRDTESGRAETPEFSPSQW